MLSPGAAFLLAYLPARQVAKLVCQELVARTVATTNLDLQHAVELVRQVLSTEGPLVDHANGWLSTVAVGAAISLPPPPSVLPAVEGWLATIARTVRPLLTTPTLEAAWSAGEAARTMQVASWIAGPTAHVRCVAPGHPELRYVAEARARDLTAAAATFGPLVGRAGLPANEAHAASVERLVASPPGLTPTTAEGARRLDELAHTLQSAFEAIAHELDEPPPPA